METYAWSGLNFVLLCVGIVLLCVGICMLAFTASYIVGEWKCMFDRKKEAKHRRKRELLVAETDLINAQKRKTGKVASSNDGAEV